MNTVEFEAWPKIARLNREIVITEKIDGSNAAVLIVEHEGPDYSDLVATNFDEMGDPIQGSPIIGALWSDEMDKGYAVYAQSRTRFIAPGNDNFGFARWVQDNAQALVRTLGAGRHFGEWWGSGIQRGYGLAKGEKRFSLFNAGRWADTDLTTVPGLGVVPVLYQGPFSEFEIHEVLANLATDGSVAAPGFMNPEGIVIWHDAARISFKVTLVGDEKPKGQEARA